VAVLRPNQFAANDVEDMVLLKIGELRPRICYQTAFELAHHLRMACKAAARHDRAPANFWLDMDIEDLNDCPRPHKGFRRSRQAPNVTATSVRHKGAEVCVLFDGRGEIMGYEDGIRLHQMIRRAGRRAKAWAGDPGKGRTMLANLTNAEDDYRLGII
jgi:hypothetical protein